MRRRGISCGCLVRFCGVTLKPRPRHGDDTRSGPAAVGRGQGQRGHAAGAAPDPGVRGSGRTPALPRSAPRASCPNQLCPCSTAVTSTSPTAHPRRLNAVAAPSPCQGTLPLENVICSYGRPCLVSCRRAVLKLSGRELAITRTRPPSRTAVLVAACDTPTPAPQCSLGPGDPPPCLPAPLSCTSWSAEVPPRPGPAPCARATTSPV